MTKGVFERLEFLGTKLIDENKSTISTDILDPNGVPSGKIIRMSDPWQVQYVWSIGGPVGPFLGGKFELEVDAEYLDEEIVCKKMDVLPGEGTWNSVTNTLDFKKTVPVEKNKIPKEGVYKVMKHLHYTAPFGGLKTVAFVEGEDIEFF